jgi:hypothetical protein
MVKAIFLGPTFPLLLRFRKVGATRAAISPTFIASIGVALCFLLAPSHAAPIIVKDLSYAQGGTQFSAVPTSVPFDFRIYEPMSGAPTYVNWREHYSEADVGKSFFAPPEIIADATAALSSTSAVWEVLVNGSQFNFHGGLWSFGFPPNHYLTAIERIIDNLVITPIHETRYTLQFAHRIRVWAEPIPEPTAAMLALLALVTIVVVRS